MQRITAFAIGEYYHIYNRGTEKRTIFLDTSEYTRFIELLYLVNQDAVVNMGNIKKLKEKNIYAIEKSTPLVSILAYCLMPNHFHLLIREEREGGVSRFMLKLQTAYSMYFNKRHGRTGRLFQGSFKSEHISDENYLTYIFSYIHMNPVKLLVDNWKSKNGFSTQEISKIKSHTFSSLQDYIGIERPQSIIVNKMDSPFLTQQYTFAEMLDLWFTHRNTDK